MLQVDQCGLAGVSDLTDVDACRKVKVDDDGIGCPDTGGSEGGAPIFRAASGR
jgi:hypothetical protein